ncbi:uncharacterized protein BDW47DRAFT_97954 [Aspergillus candidus]|uniref:Uncharacterized protein n=1 Tax=Aspergillus candidus TaxID=41067 RepID=A0A2I2FNE4_ASPCN|nr:hypothetical protein BDW47DRAFT_97954 [Aspergillus candidus]PLB42150.1 hypothetical protein BDW47DRAFT_97954 [Aspergillus candidus]
MSSPTDPTRPGKGKQEGLGKYIKRMSTALKRTSTSKSVAGSAAERSPTQETTPTAAPKSKTKPAATKEPAFKPAPPQPAMLSHWSVVQEEKARALFAKYGMTLDPGEWKSPNDVTVQRVTKPIRMRVRRTCHRCQTTFGPDKLCVNCQHVRCKKCPRHPAAKSHDHGQQNTEAALKAILARKANPAMAATKRKEPELTLPSRTGGQDLVRRPIVQRVRRTCHRCCVVFASGTNECASCHHIRCKKCPRDPPKLHKYPDGYPGDAEPPREQPPRAWRKPRQRVRYTCHQCSTVYRSGEKLCSNCGQEKGPQTLRDPPKKQRPEPDPAIVKQVEERLAKVNLDLKPGE